MYWAPKRLLTLVIVLAVGYLIVVGSSSTKKLVNKEVTIEVATPHGTVRGSSVFELTHSTAPWWYPSAVKGAFGIRGEAPYVELEPGRYVFMLLHDHLYQKDMVSYLISQPDDANSPSDHTPIFVTFENIEDANTIQQVNRNAMDRTFGSGYRLVSVTVTNTQEHATQGKLAKRFPALYSAMMRPALEREPSPRKMPGFQPFTPDLRRQINWGAFDSVPRP